MSASFKYGRGVYVEDQVTGVKGVIMARMDSLTGCNRYCVQPPLHEGKLVDAVWFDEHSLVVDTSKTRLTLDRESSQPPG